MKKLAIKTVIVFVFFAMTAAVSAQVNTLYYMKTVSTRNDLNPAFQSYPNVYIQLPVISGFYFAGGNNSLIMNDVIFPKFGETVTFLHKEYGDKDKLYDQLSKGTRIFTESQIDLIGFGFRAKKKNFFTFGISEKVSVSTTLPKDLFKLALYGTPDTTNVNTFNFKNLNVNANVYTEIALGYSRNVNDNLTIGGKAKFLLGQANVNMKSKEFSLDASRDQWIAHVNSEINVSAPYMEYYINDEKKLDSIDFNEPDKNSDYFDLLKKPAGYGGALDLGVSYYILNKHLHLSAAVLDLGYMQWNKNTAKITSNGDFEFAGKTFELDDNYNVDLTDLGDVFDGWEDSIRYQASTGESYGTWLPTKVMLGVEYGVLNNKITFGALSKTIIANQKLYEEVTASINFLPKKWFNASLSYSFMNGRWNNLGLGLGGRIGPFNLYVAADYIPLKYTAKTTVYEDFKFWYPTHTQQINIKTGLVLNFGYREDDDKDGVLNRKDDCPDTPRKVKVDKRGCPKDTDGDGVPDYLDECPGTPPEAWGTVDERGCPKDSDGDGVFDYLDKCPDTPLGVEVDEHGCPLDSDGDGVPDYLDKCPGTPKEAWGTVDEHGCPKDSDGDGVPDYLDKCSGTPKEAWGTVDEHGCPKDRDGDGVFDYIDECPDEPGPASNNGCPEIVIVPSDILFDTGKAVVKSASSPILNNVAKEMNDNPNSMLKIEGHTDNVGSPTFDNQKLSEKRAAAVKDYLMKKGVAESRIKTEGFADRKPKVDNDTPENRAKNRRVELKKTTAK